MQAIESINVLYFDASMPLVDATLGYTVFYAQSKRLYAAFMESCFNHFAV